MAHILIADDDEIVAELACNILMDEGHACGWVSDGEQARKLLEWRRPDLLLLDQDMPGVHGSRLLRELRNSELYYDLPIIMFTALTGKADEDQARYHGAQDYVRKPFEPERLASAVADVLAARADRPKHLELQEVLRRNAGWETGDRSEGRRSLA